MTFTMKKIKDYAKIQGRAQKDAVSASPIQVYFDAQILKAEQENDPGVRYSLLQQLREDSRALMDKLHKKGEAIDIATTIFLISGPVLVLSGIGSVLAFPGIAIGVAGAVGAILGIGLALSRDDLFVKSIGKRVHELRLVYEGIGEKLSAISDEVTLQDILSSSRADVLVSAAGHRLSKEFNKLQTVVADKGAEPAKECVCARNGR